MKMATNSSFSTSAHSTILTDATNGFKFAPYNYNKVTYFHLLSNLVALT